MKKIIIFIAAAFLAIAMVDSCGISKKVSSHAVSETGTGYAMTQDLAYDKAVSNALAKISKKNSTTVNTQDTQKYVSSEKLKSGTDESLSYESTKTTKSEAIINHFDVDSEYRWLPRKGQWECKVTVSTRSDNIE